MLRRFYYVGQSAQNDVPIYIDFLEPSEPQFDLSKGSLRVYLSVLLTSEFIGETKVPPFDPMVFEATLRDARAYLSTTMFESFVQRAAEVKLHDDGEHQFLRKLNYNLENDVAIAQTTMFGATL